MRLRDLKVLELSGVLAGPSVGQFFAEAGARVTKVESHSGDITRSWRIPGEKTRKGTSAYYLSVNHGKKVIRMELSRAGDRKKLAQLIRRNDIVLVNFARATEKKYGLSPADLVKMNPRIIVGKISGFGERSSRPAFDIVLQAESGMLSLNGTKNHPAKLPIAFIDLFAAHQLKEGILTALLEKRKGVLVHVSLMDAAMASLVNQAANVLIGKKEPGPQGMLHPNIAPYGEMIITREGTEFILAIGTQMQFFALCELLGSEALKKDRRYTSNELRVKNRSTLRTSILKLSKGLSAKKVRTAIRAGKLAAGELLTVAESLDRCHKTAFLKYQSGEIIPKTLIFNIKEPKGTDSLLMLSPGIGKKIIDYP